ncbi:AroM family protein [Ewingella americana]|jgi:protein AroM|uniref:AroM family protein n=2 Tax=Ewingella americana TaxID=41202 RepID=A0A085G7E1_EWIA3|nr:AroM family protein [Ewingella americana]KAA8726256.1 AroM family protein [Ewingella americana]KFC79636.1 AroM family protein [Ewingella americana ATCC 33852]STQ43369.1 AroM protein [Ewingella americana]
MMTSFATLTIGQAPRSDIMPLLMEYLPEESVTHVGLLDGLTSEQIEQRFSPEEGEPLLVSRLLDGTQVTLGSWHVERGLQEKVNWLEELGCETILLLCTGEFHGLKAQTAMLLEPDRIIPPLVGAIVGTHQVGIVVPVEEQIEEQANKWRKLSKKPCFAVASPYLADEAKLTEAALALEEQGAQVVVLDCIGYHRHHGDLLQSKLGIPVLLSNVLVAKLAAELIV